MLAGVFWAAKGLGASLAPSPSVEPLYSAGFLGGVILFVAALGLAVAGRSSAHNGKWIGALVLAFILTALLIGIGGPLRSGGATWYGVELPVVLAGLLWAALGMARARG